MSDPSKTETRTEGAAKAGIGSHFFTLESLTQVEAGKDYSSALGDVVESLRTQCGVMRKARGTGARPQPHLNEPWNYVLQAVSA
jgi:hypothetical protein